MLTGAKKILKNKLFVIIPIVITLFGCSSGRRFFWYSETALEKVATPEIDLL